MVGLALTHAIDHLEACIGLVMIASDQDHPGSNLKYDLDSLVSTLLANALGIVGANFNELSSKRCRRLLKGIRDPQLVKWLENSKESVLSLFLRNAGAAMEAAHAQRMDGPISLASHESRAPTTTSSSSSKGKWFEPYLASKQPFRSKRPRFGRWGHLLHQSSSRGRSASSSNSNSAFNFSRETTI